MYEDEGKQNSNAQIGATTVGGGEEGEWADGLLEDYQEGQFVGKFVDFFYHKTPLKFGIQKKFGQKR